MTKAARPVQAPGPPVTEGWRTNLRQKAQAELTPTRAGEVLAALIRARSQNGIDPEEGVVSVVERLLPKGLATQRVPLSTGDRGRCSLGARLGDSGRTVVLNGHVDTVPIDDGSLWDVDPFSAVIRDGVMWGRGAVDMKGGVAAQIMVARALAAVGSARPVGTLVLHFAADEEQSGPGTSDLLRAGFTGDVGVTTEATNLTVASAMRGMAALRIRIRGRSVHISVPEAGANPIDALPDLLMTLERLDEDRRTAVGHPLLPPSRVTPTIIRAGFEQSSLPDDCVVTIDYRLVPGETDRTARTAMEEVVRSVAVRHPTLGFELEPFMTFQPCELPTDHPVVRALRSAVQQATGREPEVTGTPFGSDVTKLIHEGGIAAVQFGPGEPHFAHAPNEQVHLSHVAQAAMALTSFVLDQWVRDESS